MTRRLFLFLFLCLAIRFLFIGNPGFVADVAYWKSWSLAASDKGVVWLAQNTNFNYPPAFGYVLLLMGKLYRLFANPYNFGQYWNEANFLFLFLAKIPSIICDLAIAYLIYRISSLFLQGAKPVENRRGGTWREAIWNHWRRVTAVGGPPATARRTSPDFPVANQETEAREGRGRRTGENGWQDPSPMLFEDSPNRQADPSASPSPINTIQLFPLLLASLYLFHPLPILDGSIWGQVDSLGVAVFLLSLFFLFKNRPLLSCAIFTAGFLLKLQNIIYIPIFYLFILRRFGCKVLFQGLAISTLAFFILTIEFFLTGNMKWVIYLMTQNADWFPYLSLNAYNLWWIVAGGAGMASSDKILTFGIVNAKTLGLILFSSAYFLSLLLILKEATFKNLLLSSLLAVLAFFNLLTQSHERYIFPAIPYMILLLPYFVNRRVTRTENRRGEAWHEVIWNYWRRVTAVGEPPSTTRRTSPEFQKPSEIPMPAKAEDVGRGKTAGRTRRQWIQIFFFLLLSLTAFYNVHNGLVTFYPQYGLPLLSSLNIKALTIGVSFVNMLLLAFLIFHVVSRLSLPFSPFAILSLCSFAFPILALVFLNLNYLGGQVPLTSLTHLYASQGFGTLQYNQAVNSSFSPKNWTRLSVQYFFYRKGLGTHANSEIVYNLGGKFKKLTTDFGIDTEAGTESSAVFKIYGDDKLLFASKTMGRFDLPKHAEVDLLGVKNLRLVTEDAGDGNRDDHTDWLNPILIK